jgi:hypothetical protein
LLEDLLGEVGEERTLWSAETLESVHPLASVDPVEHSNREPQGGGPTSGQILKPGRERTRIVSEPRVEQLPDLVLVEREIRGIQIEDLPLTAQALDAKGRLDAPSENDVEL